MERFGPKLIMVERMVCIGCGCHGPEKMFGNFTAKSVQGWVCTHPSLSKGSRFTGWEEAEMTPTWCPAARIVP